MPPGPKSISDRQPNRLEGERALQTRLFTGKSRYEHFMCLLSKSSANSTRVQRRLPRRRGVGRRILVARLEDFGNNHITSARQRCDLFTRGEHSDIQVPGGPPMRFTTGLLTPHSCAVMSLGAIT
jgi:hypothetical protein